MRGQTDKTVAALSDLVTKPRGHLPTQYETYSRELGALLESMESAREEKAATREVVDEYFRDWDEKLKTLKSEEMRKAAQTRRTQSGASFTTIRAKMAKLKEVEGPFITDLKDINQYLSTDLTRDGVRTIEDIVRRSIDQSGIVLSRLDDVIARIDMTLKAT